YLASALLVGLAVSYAYSTFKRMERSNTTRSAAIEALRKNEERFRSLIQNVSDILIILSEDGTLQFISPSIERISGHSPQELLGKNEFDYTHSEDKMAMLVVFQQTHIQPGLMLSPEFRFRHKNGTWVRVEAIGNNLLTDPTVHGYVIAMRDITDRH